MYAVIATGGKQERVEVGSRINVELLSAGSGEEVTFAPVLVVDEAEVMSAPADLAATVVSGRVIGEAKGPKIVGFTYKAKARQRRRFGHRQHYTTVEITSITPGTAKSAARSSKAAKA